MRTWIVVLAAASVAACGGKSDMSAELRDDLELISSARDLELASSPSAGMAVVSEVEQVARRNPAPAPAARAPRPRPNPAPPVRVAPQMQVEQQVEAVAAAEREPPPQPTENRGFDGMGETAVAVSGPAAGTSSGPATRSGGGSGVGSILAGVGIAVVRGGVVIGDVHCPPPRRRTNNHDPRILINERMPVIRNGRW